MTSFIRLARLSLIIAASCVASPAIAAPDGNSGVRVVPDNLFHIKFVDEQRAWVTGYHGTVLRSDDAGQSWHHLGLQSDELIRRGAFPSRDVAWLVGHRGSIFHSADAGNSWQLSYQQPDIYLRDIAFLDTDTGWAVGHEGTILHTRDGGKSWLRQHIGDWTRRDLPRLSGITVLDAQRAVVTGEFGVVAYTSNGGDSWRHVLIEGEPSMTAIASHGETILAVGLDGAVAAIAITPEGAAAQRLPLDIPTHLLDIRITAQGVLVSGFGVVVHCADLQSCAVQPTTERFPSNFLWLAGVDLAPDGSVWAVGLGGHVGRAENLKQPIDTAFILGGQGWADAQAGGDS